MSNEFESFETRTARILSRYSFFDLREMSDEDLERGQEMFLKAEPLKVEFLGFAGFIEVYRVTGDKVHEVRRFENFAFCSCHDFYYGNCCKQVLATMPAKCKCGRSVKVQGLTCAMCEQNHAIYFKNPVEKPVRRIAGIRV